MRSVKINIHTSSRWMIIIKVSKLNRYLLGLLLEWSAKKDRKKEIKKNLSEKRLPNVAMHLYVS